MDLDSFEFALDIGNENSIWMMERGLFEKSTILDLRVIHGVFINGHDKE